MANQTDAFVTYAQKYAPKFKIAFKDQSRFMKFLAALMFFSKDFMTAYTTTIGNTIYVPSKAEYEANSIAYLDILTHEFVHVMDGKKYNLLFPISYMLPQLLAIFAFLAFIAIGHSHYWLLSLLALVFAAPLPAYFRSYWELRGYSMDIAYKYWSNGSKQLESATTYVDNFLNPGYYWMWPFKKNMVARFQKMIDKIADNSILNDKPYRIVHDWVAFYRQNT